MTALHSVLDLRGLLGSGGHHPAVNSLHDCLGPGVASEGQGIRAGPDHQVGPTYRVGELVTLPVDDTPTLGATSPFENDDVTMPWCSAGTLRIGSFRT